MNNNVSTKKVTFANQAMVITPEVSSSLSESDIEKLWYQDDEIYNMIRHVKKTGELPLFWSPLRMQRLKLLYSLVAREQFNQRAKNERFSDSVIDWEAYATASRKLTAYSTILALKRAQKIAKAEEVYDGNASVSTNVEVKKSGEEQQQLEVQKIL